MKSSAAVEKSTKDANSSGDCVRSTQRSFRVSKDGGFCCGSIPLRPDYPLRGDRPEKGGSFWRRSKDIFAPREVSRCSLSLSPFFPLILAAKNNALLSPRLAGWLWLALAGSHPLPLLAAGCLFFLLALLLFWARQTRNACGDIKIRS